MKTTKSPESAQVTPSKKKLKQARLPFKLISEVSPAPVTPPRRKRKLSASDVESAPKVGKITKENDIVEVVISDDESRDGQIGQTADNHGKTPNPYVKLVDTAFKKKQKAKGSKKKRNSRKKSEVKENGSIEENSIDDKVDCELMDVDEPNTNKESIDNKMLCGNEENTKIKPKETETVNKSIVDIVVLEDSNSCTDVKQSDSNNELLEDSKTQIKDASVTETDPNQANDEKSSKNYSNESSQENSDSPDKKVDDSTEIKTPFTPKRSARNKAKAEENKGSPSSKLNESMTSNPTTPKQSRSSSVTKLDESVNESAANLTPKQLQKKLESAKKREKLEKEKQERERKRQEEKEERAKQRQEKDDLKKKEREEKEEAKRKEREEKEEQRRKEKEEKEKQKELEKKQREEKEEFKRKEKEEKEEQRKKEKEAREEEKRKRQEAMDSEKLEQEAKKKKAAEAFANFFVPKQKIEKDQTVGAINNCMLSSFTIKSDMRLAPTTRTQLSDEKAKTLERLLKDQSVAESKLYVKSLKYGVKPLSSSKTWPLCDLKDDDVILVVPEDELPPSDGEIISCDVAPREKLRPKLFSFHENRRPPYWGTWRKKSKFVKPRRPFGQDEKQMDYEVDSDDDWEEEAEGESLDGSAAGSDDEQDNDEYEVDNEVFVPHGYLSDEEATMDEDDVLSLSPETQKARLKHLEDEFESEMKKPTEKLKPRLYGLLWEGRDGGKPENCVDAIWSYFGKLSMIMNDPTPLLQPSKEPEETEKKKVKKKKSAPKDGEGEKSPKTDKKKKVKTVEEKEQKPAKTESKKNVQDAKKNQPVINMFLKKIQSSS